MKFNNQSTFNGHQITNVVDRPILHKKGKQWITIGLSTLLLAGLGTVATTGGVHASNIQNNNVNSNKVNSNATGDKPTPSNITTKANELHDQILSNEAMYHHSNVGLSKLAMTPKSVGTQSASNSSNSVSNQSSSSNVKSSSNSSTSSKSSSFVSDNGMTTLNLGNKSEQKRSWNFVQDGINNNDLDNAKTGDSSSASGDQTTPVSSASAKSSVASGSNSASKIPSNAPINAHKPSFNSAYMSYEAQMSNTDSKVASMNAVNAQSNSDKRNIKKPLIKDDATNYFSGKITKTGNDDGLNYKVYANGGVEFTGGTANSDLSKFSFNPNTYSVTNSDVHQANAIKFDSNVDTSKVTNMSNMFDENYYLQNLDLGSHFNTSNVNDMSGMFHGDSSLTNITSLSNWNTSNVKNMSYMFCQTGLTKLTGISDWNTSNVRNMSYMFAGDSSLTDITPLSNWNTSNVRNMEGTFGANMFHQINGDTSLTDITPLSNWDTSNVNNMSWLFADDSSITNITPLSNWDTSNVNNMSYMFAAMYPGGSALSNINPLKYWNTLKVTNMNSMFTNLSVDNKTPIPKWSIDINGTPNDTLNNGNGGVQQRGDYNVHTNGKFNYMNQHNTNVGNAQFSISGTPNVNQNVEPQADNDKPNGYRLGSTNPIDMDNNQQDQTINVNVVGNNISDKPVTIYENKYDNGKYIGQDSAIYHTGQGETGNTFTINPNNYTPAGYKTSSNPVSDIFVPNGVQTSNYTFNYNAQTGTPITVNYINQHGQPVGSGQIKGNVDDTGNDATKKVNVPNNYNLNNGQNLNYHITTNPQTINLNVTGKPATVTFNFNNQHGNHVGSDTVNTKVGDTVKPNSYPKGYAPNPAPSFTVYNAGSNTAPTSNVKGKSANQDNDSGNYKPKNDNNGNDIATNTAKGYATIEIVKYSSGQTVSDSFKTYDENNVDVGDTYTVNPPSITDYTANANQSLTGTVKSDGSLSNGYAKFIYQANHDNNQISVQYKNQDGNVVANGSVGGTYDEKGTINSLPSTNNINNNYTLNNNVDYQINHTQSPLIVNVTGKSASATINFTNQNGKSEGSTTIHGRVGDKVSPSSNQYPQGYTPNPAPSYTFNNAGNNNSPTTATVKGQSASDINGSKNYTPKSDSNNIGNNAKHGYVTVETVKYSSGQLISDSYKTVNENNVQVGNSFTLSPQNITNYTTSDKPVNETVNPDGSLSNNGFAKFVYNANKDNSPIHVQYINQDNNTIYSDEIYGTYDEKGTITNLPSANYTLNNNVPYQFEADSNPLNVAITGKPANATINFTNQSGDKAGSEHVSGRAGDTVKPSQYPSGYVIPNPAPTYHFNTAGTNPDKDGVKIKGTTASDLNGSKEYNPTTPASDKSKTDPDTDTNNPLNPNSSKNNNTDKFNADHGYATINIVKYINNKIVDEYAHVINENPSHSVGDHYSIDPDSNELLPYGYKPSTSTTSLNGTIQPNGSLSNGTATFNYVVDPSMIKPIQVTFYNQKGSTMNVHTGDDSDTNDTEYINSNQLATLGPVGAKVNIMPFLTAPYGYHFTPNEVAKVTLQQKPKGVHRGFGMMLLAVHMPGKQDLANMAINNDSAEANNDLNIARTFIDQSAISGSVKSDINDDITTMANDSADIHNDINGGYASETNANDAFDNANIAYDLAYSEYANATSNYASSVASVTANNIASGSAQTASAVASKVASESASTALVNASNEAQDKENKLQQEINDTKDALQKAQNNSAKNNTSNQNEITALRNKITKLQQTLANTKKRDANSLASEKASATNNSSYANSMANSEENNLEQQLINTKLELQENQLKGKSAIQDKQNEINGLRTKITKLQTTLINTKKQDSNSLASTEANNSSVASVNNSIADSKESSLEQQLNNAKNELQINQSSSTSTINNKQQEITGLRAKIANIQQDLVNTKSQDANNLASEATKDATNSSLASNEASSKENNLEQQLANAENELHESQSSNQSTIKDTQNEMAQLRDKINKLQQTLADTKQHDADSLASNEAKDASASASANSSETNASTIASNNASLSESATNSKVASISNSAMEASSIEQSAINSANSTMNSIKASTNNIIDAEANASNMAKSASESNSNADSEAINAKFTSMVASNSVSASNVVAYVDSTNSNDTMEINSLIDDLAKLSNNSSNTSSQYNHKRDVININSNSHKKHDYGGSDYKPVIHGESYYVYSPTNIILHGKTGSIKINKHRGFTGKIIGETKMNGKRAYVVQWHHKNYVVNAKKVRNAYVQNKDFKHMAHGLIQHATVKFLKNARIYNSIHFTGKHVKAHVKAGSTFAVIGVKKFGRKGYHQTRLVLSNGLIITANRNYVKLI